MKYKVIDPRGISFNGELHEKGSSLEIPRGAILNAFLHFDQVEASKESEKAPDKEKPTDDPKGKGHK